ncbi:MAG TPA: hypothetical protein VEH52_00775 [Gaiellaceae bacterium]|nr:hypothetical protein [Gaiellaceae bacterium]
MHEAGGRTALGAVAIAVVVAAGCGGSGRMSKSAYEQKLQAEGAELKTALSGFGGRTNDLSALATQADVLRTKLDKSGDDLDALEPPKDAAGDNAKIASTLHSFADIVGRIAVAARAGDRAKIQQQITEFRLASVQGAAAAQDLQAKDYDVGAFGG